MKAAAWLRGVLWRLLQIPGVPLFAIVAVLVSAVLEVVVVVLQLLCWLLTGHGQPDWLHRIARKSYFYSEDRVDWRDRGEPSDRIEPPPPRSRRGPPA